MTWRPVRCAPCSDAVDGDIQPRGAVGIVVRVHKHILQSHRRPPQSLRDCTLCGCCATEVPRRHLKEYADGFAPGTLAMSLQCPIRGGPSAPGWPTSSFRRPSESLCGRELGRARRIASDRRHRCSFRFCVRIAYGPSGSPRRPLLRLRASRPPHGARAFGRRSRSPQRVLGLAHPMPAPWPCRSRDRDA